MDSVGREVTSFEGLAHLGRRHFQELFREDNRVNIVDVVRMAQFFPRFVNEEENRALMEEVTEVELQEVLYSFQKNKIPGPMGGPWNSSWVFMNSSARISCKWWRKP
jgi:hypothetical protein